MHLEKLHFLRFFFTTGALGIFADHYNWIDGLFSTSIMAVMSGVYAAITFMFGVSFIRNDTDKTELQVFNRAFYVKMFFCVFFCFLTFFIFTFFFSHGAATS